MKRASIFVVVAILVAACEGSPSSQPPDQSQDGGQSQAQGPSQAPSAGGGGGGGGGDGAALVEAANAVTDWCTLMPSDLAADLVPDASEPQSQQFPPLKCTVSNGVSVLEITYQSFVVYVEVAGHDGIDHGDDAIAVAQAVIAELN
jgi:hypothetical protein